MQLLDMLSGTAAPAHDTVTQMAFVLPSVIRPTLLRLDTVSPRIAVAGPTIWNSLSNDLRNPTVRRLALTVSDVCLKLGCFQSTSTYTVHGCVGGTAVRASDF